MRLVSSFIALALFWLALSGHYTPFLVFIGALAAASCIVVALRMEVSDNEGLPTHLLRGALTYWPWLVWEIIKSAWAVTVVILQPRMPISPTMTRVIGTQTTAAGLATFANSITLTPGTITTAVNGNVLTVHALVRSGAIDLEGGAMNARVKLFEGRC